MNNDRGSVLTLTLTFVLLFTMLGLATIHHATQQNENTETRIASEEAFWLADGGIERAFNDLPSTTYYDSANLGAYKALYSNLTYDSDVSFVSPRGTYSIYSAPEDCDPDLAGIQPCPGNQHKIKALGKVMGQIRQIQATVGKHDVDDAITSHGPIADDCEPKGNAKINGNCDENAAFTFEEVFGKSLASVIADADNEYTDPCNNCIPAPANRLDGNQAQNIGLWGTTYVHFTSGNPSPGLNINNTENLQHIFTAAGPIIPSLLIIDTREPTAVGKLATVKIEGGTGFRGIIWIMGEADIQGGTEVHGSIFVDCTTCANVRVSGTAELSFDAVAVTLVIEEMWGGSSNVPDLRFITWSECPPSGCSF